MGTSELIQSAGLSRFTANLKHLVPPGSAINQAAVLAALAHARGATTKTEIAAFADNLPRISNPFPSIPTSDRACDRIKLAIERKEKVAIIGDYDVDGTISTVLLFEFLFRAGLKAHCFIPDRIEDDYGVTQKAADKCMDEHNPTLIISVDCGSTSTAIVAGLKTKGVDFIVIDHHEPGEAGMKNPAIAHLNPKAWPGHSELVTEAASFCAGGLVFFFVFYLSANIPAPEWSYDRALILAGIATVADVMPLTRTNRAVVKHSIRLINSQRGPALVPGIVTLANMLGAPEFSARAYGWIIGPHLNAAGRVAHARTAANLIASFQPARISAAASELIAVNKERKGIQDVVQEAAMEQAKAQLELDPARKFLVLYGDHWHPGVVGIVAGRVRERFKLPAIVCGLHPDGGYWKGSARSISGCALGEIVHAAVAEKVVLGGGGHQAAAGVRVGVGAEEAFRTWLEQKCASLVWDKSETVEIVGDYLAMPPKAWEQTLEIAGPFGNGSPVPAMTIRGKLSGDVRTLVTGKSKVFGVSFPVRAEDGREYKLSWLGIADAQEAAEAQAFLRSRDELTFAVRQSKSVKDGWTYLNLEVAGLPQAA